MGGDPRKCGLGEKRNWGGWRWVVREGKEVPTPEHPRRPWDQDGLGGSGSPMHLPQCLRSSTPRRVGGAVEPLAGPHLPGRAEHQLDVRVQGRQALCYVPRADRLFDTAQYLDTDPARPANPSFPDSPASRPSRPVCPEVPPRRVEAVGPQGRRHRKDVEGVL